MYLYKYIQFTNKCKTVQSYFKRQQELSAFVGRSYEMETSKKHQSPRISPQSSVEQSVNVSQDLSDVPSDIIIESRIKYGSHWSACKGIFMDYSKKTTIHGIRYLLEVHRPLYEKVYWCVILLTSLYFTITQIWAVYLKWQDTPVILGFDETLVPVHKIPFPTVTICPEIKMYGEVFDFGEVAELISNEIYSNGTFRNDANISEKRLKYFAANLELCTEEMQNRFVDHFLKNISPNITKTLVELAIPKNKTAPFCKWNGRFYFCDKILNLVATTEGICYQFNGLRSKDIYRDERYASYTDDELVDFNNFYDKMVPYNNITGAWTLKDGYTKQGYNSYPQRTAFSSLRKAFVAFLHGYEHNIESNCRNFSQGYMIYLNSPESVPMASVNHILLPHNHELLIKVLPQYIVASKGLTNFSPAKRQCYFEDERYLNFFLYYSQTNCKVECLTNYTIAKCGCVKYWMPKPFDVPICKHSDILCSRAARENFDSRPKLMCDCLPACNSLEYDFEISLARYDLGKTLKAMHEEPEYSDFLGARLIVTFKENQFTAIKRTVLFSGTKFIADIGGIFPLFMGFSMLSFIEFIYFFSIRLLFNLLKRYSNARK